MQPGGSGKCGGRRQLEQTRQSSTTKKQPQQTQPSATTRAQSGARSYHPQEVLSPQSDSKQKDQAKKKNSSHPDSTGSVAKGSNSWDSKSDSKSKRTFAEVVTNSHASGSVTRGTAGSNSAQKGLTGGPPTASSRAGETAGSNSAGKGLTERPSTGCSRAGSTAGSAGKGARMQAADSSATYTDGRARPSTAGSKIGSTRPTDTREKGHVKKAAMASDEEDMDWEFIKDEEAKKSLEGRSQSDPHCSGIGGTPSDCSGSIVGPQALAVPENSSIEGKLKQSNVRGALYPSLTSPESGMSGGSHHLLTDSKSSSLIDQTGGEDQCHGQGHGQGHGHCCGQGRKSPETRSGDSDQGGLDTDPDAGGYADRSSDDDEHPTYTSSPYDQNKPWKGVPLEKLRRIPDCSPPDPNMDRKGDHYVAINYPLHIERDKPYAKELTSRWDSDHVRMPFDDHSKCTYNRRERRRWEVIVEALMGTTIKGPFELEEAILKYNQPYVNKWKFTVLHHYFLKVASKEERVQFFEDVLPGMIKLALNLEDVCRVVPLLRKGRQRKLTLSQYQISCLLANAFLCTFPHRNSRSRLCEYSDYPDINFSHLFVGDPLHRKMEKMKCIVHYFKRVLRDKEPKGLVTFSRQVLNNQFNWRGCNDNLSQLHVSSTGTIEDNGEGMLQVDFANKYLGGGVLGHGCVQEEIRFLICPEMIITRLFTQSLDPLESLVMTGCERYSKYTGYADSFSWDGNYDDQTPRDKVGRLCCEVVAIDAMVFKSDYAKQFKPHCIDRELNKAYSGFKTGKGYVESNTNAVCTGNWGCGAFGGDKQLKALIQIMAASVSKREVCYFTFGDDDLTKAIFNVHDRLKNEKKTVGDVYRLLEQYGGELGRRHWNRQSLFSFIHSQLESQAKYARHDNYHRSGSRDTGSPTPRDWFDQGKD